MISRTCQWLVAFLSLQLLIISSLSSVQAESSSVPPKFFGMGPALTCPGATLDASPNSSMQPAAAENPLDISLPAGTVEVAIWSDIPASNALSFEFKDATGAFTLADGASDTTNAVSGTVLTPTFTSHIDTWTLHEVTLTIAHQSLKLTGISIAGTIPVASEISGPGYALNGVALSDATRVWKIKDFVSPKPSSIAWTAINYYDYGFDRDAAIAPGEWQQSLNISSAASLDLLVRKSNGEPIWSQTYSGDEINSPLPLPKLPVGCYFVDFNQRDTFGVIRSMGTIVYQVLRDDSSPPLPVDHLSMPLTLLGIRYGGPSAAVNQTLTAKVKLAGYALSQAPGLTLQWNVTNTQGAQESTGSHTFRNALSPFGLQLPTSRAGGYRFDADLTDSHGDVVEHVDELYGVSDPLLSKAYRSSQVIRRLTDSDYRSVANLSIANMHFDPQLSRFLPTNTLPYLIDWSNQSWMTPQFSVDWNDVEPVEGCYEWRLFDQLLQLAQKHGKKAWLSVYFTGDTLPQWLWFEELTDQNQQTIHAGYHYVTPFGPNLQRAQNQLIRQMLLRFANDPRVAGFMIHLGPTEGFLTDTPPSISDYSAPARAAFVVYLRRKYNGSMTSLNNAWSAHFAGWNSVNPPTPDWSKSWETSTAWWDFQSFKQAFVTSRVEQIQKLARQYAPGKPLISYGKEGFGSTGSLAAIFKRNEVRYTNGGGEESSSYIETCIMRNDGVAVNNEGHYVMPNIGSVSLVIANSVMAGGYQGQNVQWGLVWAKTPHVGVDEYTRTAELSANIARHELELSKTAAAQPWAGYFDGTYSMLDSRSFRTDSYRGIFELTNVSGINLHSLCSWVDDTSSLSALSMFPLIVDTGSKVLTKTAITTLMSYISSGGTLVCSTDTGSFSPAQSVPNSAFLRAIGATQLTFGQRGTFTDSGEKVRLNRFDNLAWSFSSHAKPLLTSPDGHVMVWIVPHGKGHAIVASGEIDLGRSALFLKEAIDRYSGYAKYVVTAKDTVGRILQGSGRDYIVLLPRSSDHGENHTYPELTSMPPTSITITGFKRAQKSVTDLSTGANYQVVNGEVNFNQTPGIVAILAVDQ